MKSLVCDVLSHFETCLETQMYRSMFPSSETVVRTTMAGSQDPGRVAIGAYDKLLAAELLLTI